MKHRDGILDLVRGISALLVMLGHLRAFLFVDYADAGPVNVIWKGFYLVTGFGHQAVMVFFVLSGYFVGGSILSAINSGEGFSWKRYATARLSRLWTVLIPTLLLTLALDSIGRQLSPEAYSGLHAEIFSSGPAQNAPASLGLFTFLGNLLFLQTIESPVYGSNGPLWSLANEFWYYVIFPLLALGCVSFFSSYGRTQKSQFFKGLVYFTVAAAILFWLPKYLIALGLIWLMGVAVWWLSNRLFHNKIAVSLIWRILLLPIFLGCLIASKSGHWIGSDWMVGGSFSILMLTLLGPWKKVRWWSRGFTGLSEISYTLYVVHFPILFLIISLGFAGKQLDPGLRSVFIYTGIATGIVLFSAFWWWLFERNTNYIRRLVSRLLQ